MANVRGYGRPSLCRSTALGYAILIILSNRGFLIRFIFIVIAIAIAVLLLVRIADADAHYKPGTHNAVHAIQLAWCGNANRECWQGNQAIEVAKCEAAQYWIWNIPQKAVGPKDEFGNPRLSMFQMGTRERRLYGHGPDPWSQAFAAYRYYVFSGRDWSPWECKP